MTLNTLHPEAIALIQIDYGYSSTRLVKEGVQLNTFICFWKRD